MCVLPDICTPCAWCPWGLAEGIRSHGAGVTDGCDPSCGYWELNPGSSARPYALLATEPSATSLQLLQLLQKPQHCVCDFPTEVLLLYCF